MIIAVHHKDRDDRLPLPEGWAIWETDTEIGQTYKDLAEQAIESEWSHEVIVVQDDVRFMRDPAEADPQNWDVLAYGQETSPYHVCPRAFSANQAGWKKLEEVWRSAPTTLCHGFYRVVFRHGKVLNWTTTTHG